MDNTNSSNDNINDSYISNKPYCDATAHVCQECETNAHCAGNPNGEFCAPETGTCGCTSDTQCGVPGSGAFGMAAIDTHIPGGKPAPGFTFGIARHSDDDYVLRVQQAGGTAHQAKRRDGICRASPPWRVYLNYPSVCTSSIASGLPPVSPAADCLWRGLKIFRPMILQVGPRGPLALYSAVIIPEGFQSIEGVQVHRMDR